MKLGLNFICFGSLVVYFFFNVDLKLNVGLKVVGNWVWGGLRGVEGYLKFVYLSNLIKSDVKLGLNYVV